MKRPYSRWCLAAGGRAGWVFIGPLWISWGHGFTGRFGMDWGIER